MTDRHSATGDFDPLDTLIADYLQALERGEGPPRDEWLARHPAQASRLRDFLRDFDALGGDASKFRLPDPSRSAETVAPGAAPAPARPTVRYLGDYELLAEIARGGMGVVYRARQVSLNRPVALKMILAGTYATPEAVQRFRAEAEAAANLDHPNILPIYEVGEHDGHQYFSMKLVEGGSLSSSVSELMKSPRESAGLMLKLARAVQFAHQRGILHRDLKPANVLLDRDGTPFVTDFGLAKRVNADDGSTQTGSVVGTPSYMAPEQARGEKGLTTSVDVYSLGAILYELLTGSPPFKGESVFDTVKQVIDVEPLAPRSRNAAADRDLSVVALKCLQKAPERRYASAAELADDLERYLRGEPISARPVGRWEKARLWAKRNPAVAALAACLILALLTGTTVAILFADEANRRRIEAEANAKKAGEAAEVATRETGRAEAALETAEQTLAANRIALAQKYWRADDPAQTYRLLDEVPPNRRGWEWFYLDRLRKPETLTIETPAMRWLVVNADGTRLAAFADRGLTGCRVWSLPDGKLVLNLPTFRPLVAGSLSPDGKTVVVALQNGTIFSQDTTPEAKPRPIASIGKVTRIEFSPDGRRVLLGGEPGRLIDLATGAEVPLPSAVRSPVGFGPGGRILGMQFYQAKALLERDRSELTLYDEKTGAVERRFDGARAWAFSPKGDLIAVAESTSFGERVRVVSLKAGEEKLVVPIRGVPTLCFAADGERLVIANREGSIQVWGISSSRLERVLRGHLHWVNSLQSLPDGKVASCSWDRTVRLWDPAVDQEVIAMPPTESRFANRATIPPSGDRVAYTEVAATEGVFNLFPENRSQGIRVWQIERRKTLTISGNALSIRYFAFSADGSRLITGDWSDTANVYDADSGTLLVRKRLHYATNGRDSTRRDDGTIGKIEIRHLAISPDGRTAVAVAKQISLDPKTGVEVSEPTPSVARVWDATSGEDRFDVTGHDSDVRGVAFATDGKRLVTLSDDRVTMTSVIDGSELRSWDEPNFFGSNPNFSGDGTILALESHGGLQLRDSETMKVRATLRLPPEQSVQYCFSPDDRRVVTAANSTVRLWDAATGRELLTLPNLGSDRKGDPDSFGVLAVRFTPDGRRLIAALSDGRIEAWDAGPNFRPAGK